MERAGLAIAAMPSHTSHAAIHSTEIIAQTIDEPLNQVAVQTVKYREKRANIRRYPSMSTIPETAPDATIMRRTQFRLRAAGPRNSK